MGKSCVKFHKKGSTLLSFSSFFFIFFQIFFIFATMYCIFVGNHSCKEFERVRKYFVIGIFTKISATCLRTTGKLNKSTFFLEILQQKTQIIQVKNTSFYFVLKNSNTNHPDFIRNFIFLAVNNFTNNQNIRGTYYLQGIVHEMSPISLYEVHSTYI